MTMKWFSSIEKQCTSLKVFFALLTALGTQGAFANDEIAQDIPHSKDHPMLSRYPGSTIVRYNENQFDELTIYSGKYEKITRSLPSQKAKGKTYKITYSLPANRSVLEVISNYKNSLNKLGFQSVFEGAGDTELGWDFGRKAFPNNHCLDSDRKSSEAPRYFAGKIEQGDSRIWVSIFVTRTYQIRCATKNMAEIDILEERVMDDNLVFVSAKAMAETLEKTGHVALYGFFFNTDSTVLDSKSEQMLKEVSTLLKERPSLNLYVVGHTDSTGDLDHNMGLSQGRSRAVVSALISKYQVPANRIIGYGVGPFSPRASNRDEQGRSKNRRVELIER